MALGLGCACPHPRHDFSGPFVYRLLLTSSPSSELPSHTFSAILFCKAALLLPFLTKEDMAATQGSWFLDPQVLGFMGHITGVCLHSDVSLGLAVKTSPAIQLEVTRGGRIHPQICSGLTLGFPSVQIS